MATTADTKAGTVHEAAHSGGEFPPFNTATYPAQLIWLALTFGFLYFAMARWVVPRLSGIISHRRSRIGSDLDQATAMRRDAETAGQAYEKALADARANAQTIAQDMRSALAAESDERRKGLEADLASKLAAAEATIRSRTETAMGSVREVAAGAAADIIERLTGRTPDPARLEAALDRSAAS